MSVYTQMTTIISNLTEVEDRSLYQWTEWFKGSKYSANYLTHFLALMIKHKVDMSTVHLLFRKTALIKAFAKLKVDGYKLDTLPLTSLELQCYNDLSAKQMLRYKEHLMVLWPDRFKPIIECLEANY